jgi:hypothetical protein
MNFVRRSRLIRRAPGVLTGLAPALVSITTGPAAAASPLRPDPPGWLTKRASAGNFVIVNIWKMSW